MTTLQSVIARSIAANIQRSTNQLNASILNLSSGIKTNAGVADLSIGTVLRTQSSALTQANLNAGQGKSLLETAKGAVDQIIDLLQDLKDLSVKAADSSLTSNERANLNTEFQSLVSEVDRLATTTKFNSKSLLDGSISGTANLTSQTGQATENYTLLTTSDFSFSGTVAAGELVTSSTFNVVESNTVGKTAGTATLNFANVSGVVNSAIITIGGEAITFGNGTTDNTAAEAATAFVAAAEASTNNTVRSFTYLDNGDGTVTVTGADLGDGVNATEFALTNRGTGIDQDGVTFGGSNIDTSGGGSGAAIDLDASASGTTGTDRTVLAADLTLDEGLQGGFSNFTAALDTTGTQNTVTFTVDINGTTYTAQDVTLFGTGGFNSKGNTIKNGQVITFSNTAGPTNGSGEFTDNSFTLTVGASDITIAGGDQTAFETDLTNTAAGFLTQLADNKINQSRDVILGQVNPSGGDFDISAAVGTTFAGIEGFDAEGTNAKGDIAFVGDTFGDDGKIGTFGPFDFNRSTHKLTVTINGEVFTADISDNTANTGGIVDGAGSYDSVNRTITVGAGTTIVLHSAATDDGRQLRIDLSNLTDTSIDIGTASLETTFEDDLNTLFGVDLATSLSFQVGNSQTNTIGVAIADAQSAALFLNDAGTSKTLNISTISGANEASDVLDNAIDNANTILANVVSGITRFDSAIVTNNVMIQNFDASSSALLDTDFALESTLLAESTLQVNAAVAILAQEQTRIQSLLQLVSTI